MIKNLLLKLLAYSSSHLRLKLLKFLCAQRDVINFSFSTLIMLSTYWELGQSTRDNFVICKLRDNLYSFCNYWLTFICV